MTPEPVRDETVQPANSQSRPLTIIGHSHIWALARAPRPASRQVDFIDLWKHSSPLEMNELAHLDAAIPVPLEEPVVSLISGSRYTNITLYQHPHPFDFVLPGSGIPVDEDAWIIPLDAVRIMLHAQMAHGLAVLRAVRERVRGRMHHLESPPPWGQDLDIRTHRNELHPDASGAFGDRRLRLKMSRLESLILREFCDAHDIEFIPYPPGVADPNGYLLDRYFDDLIHASSAYGEIALAYILDRVDQPRIPIPPPAL